MQVIKVRGESNPAGVAGAIANTVRGLEFKLNKNVQVHVIGERANYMASKSLAIAKEYLTGDRPELVLIATVDLQNVTLGDRNYVTIVYTLGMQAKEVA